MQKYKLRVKGHCFDSAIGLRFNRGWAENTSVFGKTDLFTSGSVRSMQTYGAVLQNMPSVSNVISR